MFGEHQRLLNQYLRKLTERCNPRPVQQDTGFTALVNSIYNIFAYFQPAPAPTPIPALQAPLPQPAANPPNRVRFHYSRQLRQREERLLRYVLRLSLEEEQRRPGPRAVLEIPKVDATEVLQVHTGDDADWLQDFRCPITQKLIVGEAAMVKLANQKIMYFDKAAILDWIQQKNTNPTNNQPLAAKDVLNAPEYRTQVLHAIEVKLMQISTQEGVSQDAAKERVGGLIEKIKIDLHWEDAPSLSFNP